jgi:hypothetical protein
MAFSYNVAQLTTNPTYQVRYRLGDTIEASATFQDEEIQYSLSNNSNDIVHTCIECVSALLPRIASKPDFKVGPYSETLSRSAYDYWAKMLGELKAQLTSVSAPIMLPPTTPPLFYYNMMGVGDFGSTNSFRYP